MSYNASCYNMHTMTIYILWFVSIIADHTLNIETNQNDTAIFGHVSGSQCHKQEKKSAYPADPCIYINFYIINFIHK